jgi:radical SAM superfamily enzyme YgiQ (UPF0313 family)
MGDIPIRRRFRMIIPAFPAFNIYTRIARLTTALGPLSVATVVSHLPEWDVEVIDENNYRKLGPKDNDGLPDHSTLQAIRRADVVGLYGGLSSTIPRLQELAALYKQKGAITIAGGQHFVDDNIETALQNNVDYVVIGEGGNTISELLMVLQHGGELTSVAGIAFLQHDKVIRARARDPILNFDAFPLPDFELLRYAKVKLFPINWIRVTAGSPAWDS